MLHAIEPEGDYLDTHDPETQSVIVTVLAGVVAGLPRRRALQGLPMVIPPLRFALVETGVYRGGYPVLFNYRFMKRLNLKTVISLVPEVPSQDLQEFCFFEKVALRHVPCEKFKEAPVLMMADVTQILEIIIDPQNHPVYIHCLDGGHVTGSVVIALRRLLGWDTASIVAEHRRTTADKGVTSDELAYIEEFHSNCPLVLPAAMPKWLWEGNCVDVDGNLKKNKLFGRLKFPTGTQEVKHQAAQEPQALVGSLDALYSMKSFLEHITSIAAPTAHDALLPTQTCLWSERVNTYNLNNNRTLQSLWLDPGPAASFLSEPPPRLPPSASSYSDLRKLF